MDAANPYLPPQGAPAGHPQAGMPGERPRYFMFATVGTLVLAGLGVLAGIWAPISQLAMQRSPMFGVSNMPPEMRQMQEKIMAASMPEVMAGVGVINLFVGAWGLWAAIQLLRERPGSREPFRLATLGLAAYEVLAFVMGMFVQWRVWSAMQGAMDDFMHAHGSRPPPEAEQIVETAMKAGLVLGIVFGVAWFGCKLGFLLWARSFAGKPAVAAYIDGPA